MPCRSDYDYPPEYWENQKREIKQKEDFYSLSKEEFIKNYDQSSWDILEKLRKEKIESQNKWIQSDYGQRMINSIINVFGRTVMTNLLCEAMKLIESKNFLDETSEDLQFWYRIHKRQDENNWELNFDEIKMFESIANRRRVKIY